ncbi:MAG TPA: copper-binding protein [Burkholderiaceae bacterium]|nr:copper-binding protein [Burkholderiaceae bacterium]
MRIVAKTLAAGGLCAGSVLFAQAGSQTSAHGTAHQQTDMVDGEVQMVDKKARNTTLRQGEIRNVQMPAMTMVFNVKDSLLLDKIKKGDKVKFKVEAIDGAPTVTVMEPVR